MQPFLRFAAGIGGSTERLMFDAESWMLGARSSIWSIWMEDGVPYR